MVYRALHLISLLCCLFVTVSFVLFAHDQVAGASAHQTAEVAGPVAPGTTAPHPAAKKQPRAFIDGVARTLRSPFDSIISSDNPWVDHGFPAVVALLVYGLGLGLVARYARPGTYQPRDD